MADYGETYGHFESTFAPCTTIRGPHITARGRAVEQCLGTSYHAAVVFKRMTPRTGGRRISSHCYDDIVRRLSYQKQKRECPTCVYH